MKKSYLLFYLLLSLAACKNTKDDKETTKTEDLLSVKVTPVSMRAEQESISAAGVLSSKSELKLAFKTGGMIKKMYVNEGSYVKAGQLLAELDMSEIDAQVNQSKLGLQKAERDLERVKKLYADEVATQAQLDDATTAADFSKQQVQTAAFNQKLSRIYAPANGVVLRKIADQGELIVPFSPAIILGTGGNEYVVNVGLADREIVKIKNGQTAEIQLDAYPEESFTGRVSQIAQTVNPATGTYETELTINSRGKRMISGFIAKAEIPIGGSKQLLSVPVACLTEAESNTAKVFVLEGNIVRKRTVTVGKIFQDYAEITDGLELNEQVVLDGAGFLSDGQKVNVVK